MRQRLAPAVIAPAAALVALAALVLLSERRPWPPQPLEDYGPAPAFSLIDQLERPLSSEHLRGRVVLANFIYTNCRDICPLLSLRMQAVQDRLQREGLLGSSVQLVSFTVDPARDTPEVLRLYAERHQADPTAWRFLTGPEKQVIALVVDGFHLGVQALPPTPALHQGEHEPYEVMHSGRFVLIDPRWRIRAYYDGRELDPDRVLAAIRQLLG